jgi:myo-inositol 2-dehydrogenase / D-chiro-inositol 1-dehydrogenase
VMNSQELLVPDEIDWDSEPPVVPDENGNYPVPKPGVTQIV